MTAAWQSSRPSRHGRPPWRRVARPRRTPSLLCMEEFRMTLGSEQEGLIPVLRDIVSGGRGAAQTAALDILLQLSHENQIYIASNDVGLLAVLIAVVAEVEGSGEERVKALDVLAHLSAAADNRGPMVSPSLGLLPVLIKAVSEGNNAAGNSALKVLTMLSASPEVAQTLASPAIGLVPTLIACIDGCSECDDAYVLVILQNLSAAVLAGESSDAIAELLYALSLLAVYGHEEVILPALDVLHNLIKVDGNAQRMVAFEENGWCRVLLGGITDRPDINIIVKAMEFLIDVSSVALIDVSSIYGGGYVHTDGMCIQDEVYFFKRLKEMLKYSDIRKSTALQLLRNLTYSTQNKEVVAMYDAYIRLQVALIAIVEGCAGEERLNALVILYNVFTPTCTTVSPGLGLIPLLYRVFSDCNTEIQVSALNAMSNLPSSAQHQWMSDDSWLSLLVKAMVEDEGNGDERTSVLKLLLCGSSTANNCVLMAFYGQKLHLLLLPLRQIVAERGRDRFHALNILTTLSRLPSNWVPMVDPTLDLLPLLLEVASNAPRQDRYLAWGLLHNLSSAVGNPLYLASAKIKLVMALRKIIFERIGTDQQMALSILMKFCFTADYAIVSNTLDLLPVLLRVAEVGDPIARISALSILCCLSMAEESRRYMASASIELFNALRTSVLDAVGADVAMQTLVHLFTVTGKLIFVIPLSAELLLFLLNLLADGDHKHSISALKVLHNLSRNECYLIDMSLSDLLSLLTVLKMIVEKHPVTRNDVMAILANVTCRYHQRRVRYPLWRFAQRFWPLVLKTIVEGDKQECFNSLCMLFFLDRDSDRDEDSVLTDVLPVLGTVLKERSDEERLMALDVLQAFSNRQSNIERMSSDNFLLLPLLTSLVSGSAHAVSTLALSVLRNLSVSVRNQVCFASDVLGLLPVLVKVVGDRIHRQGERLEALHILVNMSSTKSYITLLASSSLGLLSAVASLVAVHHGHAELRSVSLRLLQNVSVFSWPTIGIVTFDPSLFTGLKRFFKQCRDTESKVTALGVLANLSRYWHNLGPMASSSLGLLSLLKQVVVNDEKQTRCLALGVLRNLMVVEEVRMTLSTPDMKFLRILKSAAEDEQNKLDMMNSLEILVSLSSVVENHVLIMMPELGLIPLWGKFSIKHDSWVRKVALRSLMRVSMIPALSVDQELHRVVRAAVDASYGEDRMLAVAALRNLMLAGEFNELVIATTLFPLLVSIVARTDYSPCRLWALNILLNISSLVRIEDSSCDDLRSLITHAQSELYRVQYVSVHYNTEVTIMTLAVFAHLAATSDNQLRMSSPEFTMLVMLASIIREHTNTVIKTAAMAVLCNLSSSADMEVLTRLTSSELGLTPLLMANIAGDMIEPLS